MMKTIVLLVYGDDDYGAMDFEEMFNAQEVHEHMAVRGLAKIPLITANRNYIHCETHEFREVDEKFVTFIIEEFLDYDQLKSKSFYFVEAK